MKMTSKTAEALNRLHNAHEGKVMRETKYDILRKVEGYVTAKTAIEHKALEVIELAWGYCEGEDMTGIINYKGVKVL